MCASVRDGRHIEYLGVMMVHDAGLVGDVRDGQQRLLEPRVALGIPTVKMD